MELSDFLRKHFGRDELLKLSNFFHEFEASDSSVCLEDYNLEDLWLEVTSALEEG